jgi:hypothetical protein
MSNQAEEPRGDPIPDVDVGMEEPSNDVLEQHRMDTDEDELEDPSPASRPDEADAADVDEQRRGVPEAPDEWREE